MAKLLDIDFRNGSLIDHISGQVGTLSLDAEILRGENGLFLSTKKNGKCTVDVTDIWTNDNVIVETWIRFDKYYSLLQHAIAFNGYTARLAVNNAAIYLYAAGSGSSGINTAALLKKGEWTHVIYQLTNDGADCEWKMYFNNVYYGGTISGYNINDNVTTMRINGWDADTDYSLNGGVLRTIIHDSMPDGEYRGKAIKSMNESLPITKIIR